MSAVLTEVGLSGDSSVHLPTISPTPDGVAEALARLDGSSVDQLYFEGITDAGRHFWGAVVGGREGHAVLHIAIDDETHYATQDSNGMEQEYAIVASGGSDIDVLSRWIVPIDRAARGLWYFLLTGSLDPGVRWDRLSTVDFRP